MRNRASPWWNYLKLLSFIVEGKQVFLHCTKSQWLAVGLTPENLQRELAGYLAKNPDLNSSSEVVMSPLFFMDAIESPMWDLIRNWLSILYRNLYCSPETFDRSFRGQHLFLLTYFYARLKTAPKAWSAEHCNLSRLLDSSEHCTLWLILRLLNIQKLSQHLSTFMLSFPSFFLLLLRDESQATKNINWHFFLEMLSIIPWMLQYSLVKDNEIIYVLDNG